MNQVYKRKEKLLRILSLSCFVAGALTILPSALAQEPSILGYRALCPFAPISTVLTVYSGKIIHHFSKR